MKGTEFAWPQLGKVARRVPLRCSTTLLQSDAPIVIAFEYLMKTNNIKKKIKLTYV
jgi:hypothetical protein